MTDVSWQEMFDVTVEPKSWPREVSYANKEHASNNAHRFLAARKAAGRQMICSDGVLYALNDKNTYDQIDDNALLIEIRATDPLIELDIKKISSMVQEVKVACSTKARPFEWIRKPTDAPAPEDLVLCHNGILDVSTMKLRPLTPDYFATATPEWDYDPEAKCPLWDAKLLEWLAPSYIPTLQEFTGYLLTPDVSLHAMLCLLGATRGGKGTIGRIQEALVGEGHYATPSFNDLAGDFGLEGFADKRVISIPDAHDTPANKRGTAVERLKQLAAADPVTINRKNMKQQLRVLVPGKVVMTANEHPNMYDESGALAEREVVIMFDKTIERTKRDPQLTPKLKAELSGIANWALSGLRRLRTNKGLFTIGADGKAAHDEIAAGQSVVLRFALHALDVTGDKADMVPLSVAFEAYVSWAQDVEGLAPRARRDKTTFKKNMLAALRRQGITFAENQIRWHDPSKEFRRVGEQVKHRFVGMRIKLDPASLDFG